MSKKRSQGEGSIFQRKDGLWVAQLTIQGKHVTKYFHSQSECREWLKATRAQVENGLTLSGAQTTLAAYLSEWLVAISSSIRPKTYRQYQQIVRQHIVPTLGNFKLEHLRPDHIQALYNQKLSTGLSNRSVILIHAVLHKSLKQALKLGLIGRNPVEAVTRPKARRKEMHTLSSDQAKVFILGAEATRYDALFYLALHTGMRQGELMALKWSDLDWSTRTLQVQRQVQRVPQHGLTFMEPKSAAGRRSIVLGPAAIEKLRGQLDRLECFRFGCRKSVAGE